MSNVRLPLLFTLLFAVSAPTQGNQYLYGGFRDLGFGTPGTSGVPVLTGTGTCAPTSVNQLWLSNARSQSQVSVICGFLYRPQQVFGGILAPTACVTLPVVTDAAGAADTAFAWPALPPGTPILFQAAIIDPVATGGVALSSVVRGETIGGAFYQVEPESTSKTKFRVAASDTGAPVSQALLSADVLTTGAQEQARSDMAGYAVFPNIIPLSGSSTDPEDPPGAQARTRMVLKASPAGYVPFKDELWITESYNSLPLYLVPLSSGVITDLIPSGSGATCVLPGIGTLVVPPGALTQDSRLQVVVVPAHGWMSSLVEKDLRYQVWVTAVDAAGARLPGVMPSAHAAGVTLRVALPKESRPSAAYERWKSVGYSSDFKVVVRHTK